MLRYPQLKPRMPFQMKHNCVRKLERNRPGSPSALCSRPSWRRPSSQSSTSRQTSRGCRRPSPSVIRSSEKGRPMTDHHEVSWLDCSLLSAMHGHLCPTAMAGVGSGKRQGNDGWQSGHRSMTGPHPIGRGEGVCARVSLTLSKPRRSRARPAAPACAHEVQSLPRHRNANPRLRQSRYGASEIASTFRQIHCNGRRGQKLAFRRGARAVALCFGSKHSDLFLLDPWKFWAAQNVHARRSVRCAAVRRFRNTGVNTTQQRCWQ
jgi:hypothetical protein